MRYATVLVLATLTCLHAGTQSPELADKILPIEARQAVQRYLTMKAGTVAMSPVPQDGPASWCFKQYEAAAKTKDARITYRLISSHLQRASQLLDGADAQNHTMGLAMVMASANCAMERLKDGWLASHIVDGYLLGHLDRANPSDQSYVGKTSLLTIACAIYLQAGEVERYAAAYQEMLQHALKKSDDNTADAARLKLADAMLKLNRPEKAKEYLDAIGPQSSLSGGASKLLPKVMAALKAKKSGE